MAAGIFCCDDQENSMEVRKKTWMKILQAITTIRTEHRKLVSEQKERKEERGMQSLLALGSPSHLFY
jgi:hypothetical protein